MQEKQSWVGNIIITDWLQRHLPPEQSAIQPSAQSKKNSTCFNMATSIRVHALLDPEMRNCYSKTESHWNACAKYVVTVGQPGVPWRRSLKSVANRPLFLQSRLHSEEVSPSLCCKCSRPAHIITTATFQLSRNKRNKKTELQEIESLMNTRISQIRDLWEL